MSPQHALALDQALRWITENYTPIGIIVSGSIIRGNPDKDSDFDIYVVHAAAFRQRVQKRFNGVPCEIFVNNLGQVYAYFESELQKNRPVSANMIATGRVLRGADNEQIIALVEAAKGYAQRAPAPTAAQLTFRRYLIATLLEDVADVLTTDAATAAHILDKLLGEVVEFIFYAHQHPLPRIKERLNALLTIAPPLGTLVMNYYAAGALAARYDRAQALVLEITGATGFFEWSSEPE